MTSSVLIRWGGAAALIAGMLRGIGSFVPQSVGAAPLELLYFCTDVCLLFGLLGLYAFQHETAGRVGFIGFVVATIGIGSLIGPEGEFAGMNLYAVGGSIFALGLCLFAVGVWQAQKLPRWIPALWVISTAIGFVGFFAPGLSLLFVVSGLLFGLSFAIAGFKVWQNAGR